MIPAEILQKIKRINITTTHLATNVFAGEYKSVFKGRGLEFHEVREYLVGDDIRLIDWNVTARSDKPHIKKFVEERELTIMLLLDASGSNRFGSVNTLKSELAAEICSVLAASATQNNDRVGLIIFTDRIEKFIPPRKGSHHILRIVSEVLCNKPAGNGTDIPMCLEYLDNVTTRTTVSFLISDFYTKDIKKSLSVANKRHDIVAVKITDPRDSELPNVGIISLNDPETGRRYTLDTSKANIRQKYALATKARSQDLKRIFNAVKIDSIEVSTAVPYTEALIKFFKTRRARRGIRG